MSNFFKFPTLQEQFGLFLEQLQQHRLSVQHSLHLSVEEDHLEGEEREEVLSLHLFVNIIYLLAIARNTCNLTIFRLVVVEALFHPPARPLYLVLDIVAVSQGDSGHQGRLQSFQSHDADDE